MRYVMMTGVLCSLFFVLGFLTRQFTSTTSGNFQSPFITESEQKELPLNALSIPSLIDRQYLASELKIESVIDDFEDYTAYVFSYRSLDKKVTGQLNIPHSVRDSGVLSVPLIVMMRGYVPPEIYETGVGTRNAAAVFAQQGYITVAPDFLGSGGSDPQPDNPWQARFERPINVVELVKSTRENGVPITDEKGERILRRTKPSNIGFWAHSNGGQIALSVLEILGEPIPTTLWAPVTAPFPYSTLFFTDEEADEGKISRRDLALFEQDYDVFGFTITHYLHRLRGPIQLHHGTVDEAALKIWSDEFVAKIGKENKRRAEIREQQKKIATAGSERTDTLLEEQTEFLDTIEVEYFTYPGADHNMVPNWNEVVARDVEFFNEKLN